MGKKLRKKPGPPKVKEKDPLRSVRVPEVEWDEWLRKAKAAGMTRGLWLRKIAKEAK